MQMESCLGTPDALRMIPLGTHAPLQLNLGRWKKTLCPTKIGITNDVSTNESLMSLHYAHHSCMYSKTLILGILHLKLKKSDHYTYMLKNAMHAYIFIACQAYH